LAGAVDLSPTAELQALVIVGELLQILQGAGRFRGRPRVQIANPSKQGPPGRQPALPGSLIPACTRDEPAALGVKRLQREAGGQSPSDALRGVQFLKRLVDAAPEFLPASVVPPGGRAQDPPAIIQYISPLAQGWRSPTE